MLTSGRIPVTVASTRVVSTGQTGALVIALIGTAITQTLTASREVIVASRAAITCSADHTVINTQTLTSAHITQVVT